MGNCPRVPAKGWVLLSPCVTLVGGTSCQGCHVAASCPQREETHNAIFKSRGWKTDSVPFKNQGNQPAAGQDGDSTGHLLLSQHKVACSHGGEMAQEGSRHRDRSHELSNAQSITIHSTRDTNTAHLLTPPGLSGVKPQDGPQ